MKKELWYPGQIEPERPSIAEIHNRYRKHAAAERKPRNRFLFLLSAQPVIGNALEFLRSDRLVAPGIVPEINAPTGSPIRC